jgi:hypothetical protein
VNKKKLEGMRLKTADNPEGVDATVGKAAARFSKILSASDKIPSAASGDILIHSMAAR